MAGIDIICVQTSGSATRLGYVAVCPLFARTRMSLSPSSTVAPCLIFVVQKLLASKS